MNGVPHPPVLSCPFDAAFECRWVGDARPPDGTPPVRNADTRCPEGYVPHRHRPAPELQGKVVVTGRPAVHRPASDGGDSSEAPKPPGVN
jgi:hypothetical protein